MSAGETWKVELHSHTLYSKDCLTSFEAFIGACKMRGIDRVAVTDHNTAAGALELAKRYPQMIIVGEEIMTTEGEILAFFVRESVPPFLTPMDTIRRLREQGAVISVSHPFDRLRKGAWEERQLRRIVEHVDALEVFNARCIFGADNRKALDFARSYGKPGTVGSDAHIPYELGRATLRMQPFEGPGDFCQALKTAQHETRLSPAWVHGMSKIAKWTRKLGIAKLPVEATP